MPSTKNKKQNPGGRLSNADRDRLLRDAESLFIRGYSLQLISEMPNMPSLSTLRKWKKSENWDEKKELQNINPRKIKDLIVKNVAAIQMGKAMPYKPDDISKLAAAWDKMDDSQKHARYCMEAFDAFADFLIDKASRKSDKEREKLIDKLKDFRAEQDEYLNSLLD